MQQIKKTDTTQQIQNEFKQNKTKLIIASVYLYHNISRSIFVPRLELYHMSLRIHKLRCKLQTTYVFFNVSKDLIL